MARKVGQIVGRGPRTWLVRVYNGRDPETKKRKYLNQTIHGGLRDAQAHLNKMLGERDRGRSLDSSKQTLNEFLDRCLELCAKPRLRAKSFRDYEGLLRRYVRPALGAKAFANVFALDIQALYRELLDRQLSARSIRYTHAVLGAAFKQAVRLESCFGESRRCRRSPQAASERCSFTVSSTDKNLRPIFPRAPANAGRSCGKSLSLAVKRERPLLACNGSAEVVSLTRDSEPRAPAWQLRRFHLVASSRGCM